MTDITPTETSSLLPKHKKTNGHGHSHGGKKKKKDHGHGHSEKEDHGHSHSIRNTQPKKDVSAARRKLWFATGLCFIFMVIEVIGGYIAGSLAIMTDAAHLLSDVAGFLISIFALVVSEYAPTKRLTFGFGRAEILGAMLSVIIIWFLTAMLVYEAINRTRLILSDRQEQPVEGRIMFIVATIGLSFNLVLLKIFTSNDIPHGHSHGGGHDHSHAHGQPGDDVEKGHGTFPENTQSTKAKQNINISAAYAHALGDLLQSIGVCIAGAIIWAFPGDSYPKVQLFDPIATFVFSVLVIHSTKSIMTESVHILMQSVPHDVDPDELFEELQLLKGVTGVHHLHVWSLTSSEISLSVHLQVENEGDMNKVLKRAQHFLRAKGLGHNTIQMEVSGEKICDDGNCTEAVKALRKGERGVSCNDYALDCETKENKCHSYN